MASAIALALVPAAHASTEHGRTTRVDVYDGTVRDPSVEDVSADGRWLAFTTFVDQDTTAVFVRDLKTGRNHQATPSGSNFRFAGMSDDGTVVAVNSFSDVPAAGDTNAKWDGFVWHRKKGTFRVVTLSSSGEQGDGSSEVVGLSADGTKVLFTSTARNLASGVGPHGTAYVRDLETGVTKVASVGPDGLPVQEQPERAVLSADGTKVLFATNFGPVIPGDPAIGAFLHDLVAGTTVRASWRVDGTPDPDTHLLAVDGDGSHVAWSFNGAIKVRDMATGITRQVTPVESVTDLTMSADARFLAWDSSEGAAVVLEVATGRRRTVSTTDGGVRLRATGPPSLTADGRRAWFSARPWVPVFTVGLREAYVHEFDVAPASGCAAVGLAAVEPVCDPVEGGR